jgi:hypothetical protein
MWDAKNLASQITVACAPNPKVDVGMIAASGRPGEATSTVLRPGDAEAAQVARYSYGALAKNVIRFPERVHFITSPSTGSSVALQL